jgi:hypothetical protein
MSSANGCPTAINHTVMIVGYGVETIVTSTAQGTPNTTCRTATLAEIAKRLCFDKSIYSRKQKECCTT